VIPHLFARPARALPRRRRARGASAVEFALLSSLFFAGVFGVVEVARIVFVANTLQEVTRRAAAAAVHVYPSDSAGIQRLRQEAVFRDDPGGLLLADPVTEQSLRIDYLALTRDATSQALSLTPIATLPPTAARNRQICMGNPNAANCIRFVRVSVCSAATATSGAGDCQPVRSRALVGMFDMARRLHRATTLAPVESFGYVPGESPCPCP